MDEWISQKFFPLGLIPCGKVGGFIAVSVFLGYCKNNMKDKIERMLRDIIPPKTPIEVFVPERSEFGHYSTNVAMRLAKTENKNPMEVAGRISEEIRKKSAPGFFERVEAVSPGFVNFWVSRETVQKEFAEISKNIKNYGTSADGKRKTVIVEYSQPNIAKKMHMGHLRTTVLGGALANIFEYLGYKVIRWNYLGDWGTQFGKLIAAYKLWGDKAAVKASPIAELQKLYIRFHDEMKRDASLENRGREEFRKLEEGDKENRKLWEWFKKESLKEFDRAYKVLGVKFDTFIGEAFFEKDMKPLTEELIKNGVVERSEGSLIIKLDKFGLPPALIEKSDGASLYLARDIASLRYRIKKFKPKEILYVVGNEQSLHFEQLFAIAKILGITGVDLVHLKYGLVLGEGGKKLATREGRTILADEVIEKAIALAKEIVSKKNTDLGEKEKDAIAEAVGIGAVKYANLKENRHSDIVFDWEKMLDFTGDSAPYLQYTYTRFHSILAKAGLPVRSFAKAGRIKKSSPDKLTGDTELQIIRKLIEFPDEIKRSAEGYTINNIANYAYTLANFLNKLYESTPILKEEDNTRRSALLALIQASISVLQKTLSILGIKTLKKI